jgi:hypothetical protein
MNTAAIKRLASLVKSLRQLRLYEHASSVERLSKLAAPIIDIVEMDPHNRGDSTLFKDKSEWLGQLELIGQNIVLMPFDEDSMSDKEKEKMMGIWGGESDSFESFKSRRGVLGSSDLFNKSGRTADIEKFESSFPDAWTRVAGILKEKDLSKDEIVLILYSKAAPPEYFDKTPFYLSHDLGHWSYDFSDFDKEDNLEKRLWFKNTVGSFVKAISSLYKDEHGESSSQPVESYFPLFFDGIETGDWGDMYSDLFALSTSSGGLKAYYKYPDSIVVKDRKYRIDPVDTRTSIEIAEDFFEHIQSWVSDKDDGPLSDLAGKVILYDAPR